MDADRGGKLRQESFVRTTKMLCVCLVGCGAALGTVRAIAQADADKMFLMKASQTDLSEIKQSQLALDKTTNPHVKAFAQKMISDHNMLELNMKPFADKNGVMPVTALGPEHQAEYDKLKGLSGADFDKEYIRSMDMDHHMALAAFDTELEATQDPDLKKTVLNGKKVITAHTKMADKLATKLGVSIVGT